MNDDDVRASRVIYRDGSMIMEAQMVSDDDMQEPDGDCYTAEDYAAFRRGDWEYVGVIVVILFQGKEVGQDSLWAVHHGTMGDGTEVDAFEWTPAVDTSKALYMGSPLWSVAAEAAEAAWEWVRDLAGKDGWISAAGSPIWRLQRCVQPINPELINEEHGLALVENAARTRS